MNSSISQTGSHSARIALGASALALLLAASVRAQVITIDTHGNATASQSTVDRRYQQIEPTHVQLSSGILDTKTKLELIRLLQAEQGFAMRPFPKGHKGLTLRANGKLDPAGEPYLNMVTTEGMCAKPGDPIQITDLKFDKNKITFMINGGPDAKHRFLRHIQIGGGGAMNPIVQDDNQDPMGARLTLVFEGQVPLMTDKDVKALLKPLISFDVKTPIEAFTDTLPPKLKEAILNHHVMVGMTTDMVTFAVGRPEQKIREMDGQMPYEEWVYGHAPDPVQFVRINGNRVIRVELAEVGKAPKIWDQDEVTALMNGAPIPQEPNTRTVAMGDGVRDPNTQAPNAPPTLHKDGEDPAADPMTRNANDTMKPVLFPKQKPDDYPDASKLPRTKPTDDPDATKPADGTKSTDVSPDQTAPKSTDKPADKPAGTPPA